MEDEVTEEDLRLSVKFLVTGIPDTLGLRLRSTEPIGLYISSRNAEAAQWYFEKMIVEFVGVRGLLVPEQGAGLRLEEKLDWNALTVSGAGETVIRAMSVEETCKMLRVSTPVMLPPVQKLATDWWKDPNENEFCIVHDPGDMIDRWLVESIENDLAKRAIN